ncbi:MAG: OmpA family protein [Alphaproteobacteria bacterium]
MQRLLISFGYEPGATNGRMAAKTQHAIRQFQQDTGLPADGRVTSELLQYMRRLAGRPAGAAAASAGKRAEAAPRPAAAASPQPAAVTGRAASAPPPARAAAPAPSAAAPAQPPASPPQAAASPPAQVPAAAKPAASAPAPQVAAKPAATPSAGEARPDKVPSISFAAGSATLTDQAKAALDALVATLKKNAALRMQVQGYASGSEAEASNARRLSLSRALAVRNYLLGGGVEPERVDIEAFGNKLKDNGPADRVDTILVSK